MINILVFTGENIIYIRLLVQKLTLPMTNESVLYYDISTSQSLQPNKYNGKELDLMHGYDYGIRISEQLINSIYGSQKNEKKS